MTDITALQHVLSEFKSMEEVSDATLVSRSGMHIAGDVPEGAHLETFVAMSAILLGAAETATSELKDNLEIIVIGLKNSKLIISSAGTKALLVLKAGVDADLERINGEIQRGIKTITESV